MPVPVQHITPQLRDIHVPAPLRDLPLWLGWNSEHYEGEAKPRKVPYYVGGGRRYGEQGSAQDRGRLTTFAIARDDAIKRGMAGVGFAPLEGEDVIALDFDKCVVDKRVDPLVLELVQGTYAEYSPSGTGIRAFFRGPPHLVGNRKSAAREDLFGIETFSSSGFVTVTGWALDHIELLGLEDKVAQLPEKVISYCLERFGPQAVKPVDPDDFMVGHEPRLGLTIEEMEELLDKLDPDMSRDEWIRVGMALHHETEGDDTGFYLWNDWSSNGGKYPSEEALRQQWDSFERRKGQRRHQTTMATVKWMAKQADAENGVASVEEAIQRADKLAEGLPPVGGVATPEGFDGKFPVVSAATASREKPTDWLIKGVLPQADLIMLYGQSGSGKSFAAIDMAAHIALGREWRGKRVTKGKVVVVAAEGGGGYGKRLKAWCQKNEVDIADLDIGLIRVPPNFMERDDIAELVASIRVIGGVAIIFVDTLAQVTPGANENTSEDMGLVISNCRVLRNATGAVVALVHHSGKDQAKGARGWSGARAAVDAELEVIHEEDNPIRQLRVTKQKDGEDGLRFAFKLEQVIVGMDDDGDEITSCAAIEVDAPPVASAEEKGKRAKPYGQHERHCIEVMSFFDGQSTVNMQVFIDKAAETMPEPEEGKRDTRRQHVMRALRNITKRDDAPLRLEGSTVVFYE